MSDTLECWSCGNEIENPDPQTDCYCHTYCDDCGVGQCEICQHDFGMDELVYDSDVGGMMCHECDPC